MSLAVRLGGWSSWALLFQGYTPTLGPLGGSAEHLLSTWAADGGRTSWGYPAGERCCRMPWKLVPSQEHVLKHPSRKHTSVCSLLMQPLQRTSSTEIPESQESWWVNAPHTNQKALIEVEGFFRVYISDRSGKSCIPVSLPCARSELFLTCTLKCRTVNTIST